MTPPSSMVYKADTAANELRRCHECNQPVAHKARFCPRCGARQPREPRGASARELRSAGDPRR